MKQLAFTRIFQNKLALLTIFGMVLCSTQQAAFAGTVASKAQQTVGATEQSIRDSQDKAAIKELVDRYSILADQKDSSEQAKMFTPNAIFETYRRSDEKGEKGELIAKIEGAENIGNGFANFSKYFVTLYHSNGQLIVDLKGDKASGVAYCTANLVSVENGKRMLSTFGIRYYDEYSRENGKWLFSKRTTIFEWELKQELAK